MKVSVSIPDEDVRFLDEYARDQGLDSRSAAVHRAVVSVTDRVEARRQSIERHARARQAAGSLARSQKDERP